MHVLILWAGDCFQSTWNVFNYTWIFSQFHMNACMYPRSVVRIEFYLNKKIVAFTWSERIQFQLNQIKVNKYERWAWCVKNMWNVIEYGNWKFPYLQLHKWLEYCVFVICFAWSIDWSLFDEIFHLIRIVRRCHLLGICFRLQRAWVKIQYVYVAAMQFRYFSETMMIGCGELFHSIHNNQWFHYHWKWLSRTSMIDRERGKRSSSSHHGNTLKWMKFPFSNKNANRA